ncbi:MAG: hypothetical protein LBV79_10450 [Candidatus Adiutrix sp.]|jgi:hypothetical protein|nr:hypothetical protein [Candidatus Adiutrix sp.]
MMTSQTFQKRGKPAFALRGRLRLVAFSLFLLAFALACPAPARAAEEEAISAAQAAPCKGLKPYNNIDELLYQFYINLDSDCLFEMSTAELEEAWGIKILDEERFKPINYYPLSETEFYYKPYKSEKDAFYVEITSSESNQYGAKTFTIRATEDYFEKYGTFFPDEELPTTLPVPTDYERAELQQLCVFPDIAKINGHFPGGTPNTDCYSPAWQRPFGKITLRAYGKITVSQTRFRKEKTSEKSQGDVPATVAKNDRSAPCRGLRPYKDLEDLLYQFYINLDSDCLFRMSLNELEEIWDTEIGIGAGGFESKPCSARRDAFTIGIRRRYRGPSLFLFDEFVIGTAGGCPTGTSMWGKKEQKGDWLKMLPPLEDVPGAWRGLYSSDKVGRIGFNWSPDPGGNRVTSIVVARPPKEQLELEMLTKQ